MIIKLIGAFSILAVCGGYGFYIAHRHTSLVRLLKKFAHILERMEWELEYRRKTLPDLCRYVSKEVTGVFSELFLRFAVELGFEGYPDMQKALQEMVRNKLTAVQRIGVASDRFGNQDVVSSVLHSAFCKPCLFLLAVSLRGSPRESFCFTPKETKGQGLKLDLNQQVWLS